jgi:2-amino-4-hydroxy-6-hydroxymethyldihydropteridine diphosphokinase
MHPAWWSSLKNSFDRMKKVYLLLGGNLNNRESLIEKARTAISERAGKLLEQSSVYETEPWGFETKDTFLNQVVLIETKLKPSELLDTLLRIEYELGRTRTYNGYESRLIDIDILFYEEEVISNNELVIPHPRIQERMFTLKPLQEINGSFVHPVLKKSIRQLVAECTDKLKVSKLS